MNFVERSGFVIDFDLKPNLAASGVQASALLDVSAYGNV